VCAGGGVRTHNTAYSPSDDFKLSADVKASEFFDEPVSREAATEVGNLKGGLGGTAPGRMSEHEVRRRAKPVRRRRSFFPLFFYIIGYLARLCTLCAKHSACAIRTSLSGGIFSCFRSDGECWKMSPIHRTSLTAPIASEKVRLVLRYQAAA
jgi:hypothetical protein